MLYLHHELVMSLNLYKNFNYLIILHLLKGLIQLLRLIIDPILNMNNLPYIIRTDFILIEAPFYAWDIVLIKLIRFLKF